MRYRDRNAKCPCATKTKEFAVEAFAAMAGLDSADDELKRLEEAADGQLARMREAMDRQPDADAGA